MSWYQTGVVSVTAGSATVTGAGTEWVKWTRPGDAFHGPDGRMYEVTNVASDTALAISPAYEGPSAAGQSYRLIPVQGYTKRLADRAAELIGSQIDIERLADEAQESADDAAASATIALDVVTDVTDKAGQAAGSAQAAEDAQAAAQSSAAASGQSAQASANSATSSSASAAAAEGFKDAAGDFATDAFASADLAEQWAQNPENTPVRPGEFSALHWAEKAKEAVHGDSFLEKSQNLADLDDEALARFNLGLKDLATKDLSELGLKSAALANIVGTMAAGDIIEQGNNANGYYVAFNSGLLLCAVWGRHATYQNSSNLQNSWTYPKQFAEVIHVGVNLLGADLPVTVQISEVCAYDFNATRAICTVLSVAQFNAGFNVLLSCSAIGRWK